MKDKNAQKLEQICDYYEKYTLGTFWVENQLKAFS